MSTWMDRLRELRLPRGERAAAAQERRAEEQMRKERDNPYLAERRAARLEAEARKWSPGGMPAGGHPGSGAVPPF